MFQKELLIVARFQTVLCQNFNVDIKTRVIAPALDRFRTNSFDYKRSIGST